MFGPHDGTRVAVHPYRRMMGFLMRGRNESAVYFEQHLDVTRTLAWLETRNASGSTRTTLFHLVLHALATVLHDRARLNRFTVGRRTYQRTGVFLSFAAKKAMSDDAPLATIKRRFAPGEHLDDLVTQLGGEVADARAAKPTAMDKEVEVLLALPGFLLAFSMAAVRRLYAWGLAPRSLVDTDPLYTSAFVANLGSLEIDAAYHHLYEHGNCPLFVTIGQITPTPAVDGDRIVVRPMLTIRYTFDERVEDGLYCARALELLKQRVEDPGTYVAA
ncbi:MAG: 2-oxo acid dehydrogenase subunit E2 [Deltaproteobacteria bacterium]|nr:2-oxo acid dehydrogenase subunit E2 [Deltaproteobacteria bacterium]MDQ3296045.1 2-oxo acid dehydrogenase subunit E2 [Myxococcota bacterium]